MARQTKTARVIKTATVQLGAAVTDKITRFSGTVTAMAYYLTGCTQVLVAPPIGSDGAYRESAWFDLQRLDVDASVPVIAFDNGATPGFDKPAPKG